MTDPQTDTPDEARGWADRPPVQRAIRVALYAICTVLLLADFVVHRHTTHALESLPGFYVLYGFASLVIAVALAKALRRIVRRKESYYDDAV